jgi:DNA repair protein RecN (Recombination protein N)
MLKKKYSGSIEEMLIFLHQSKKELDQIESLDETVATLKREIKEETARLGGLCIKLSELRNDAASKLEKESVRALTELGLHNAVFKVMIHQMEQSNGQLEIQGKRFKSSSKGIDHGEFYLSLNPGEAPKPLAKIASGGEISRIMLALKSVLAEADNVPILIFDEIDTGISGRIARVVGNYLKLLSRNHQVICITHLPQIASIADKHYSVEKKLKDNRTFTTISELDQRSRIKEIAKLLGGDTITDTTLQGARELLNIEE